MSHSKAKMWLVRGVLWLALMALIVGPAAVGAPSGVQPATAAGSPAGVFIYLVADTFDPLLRQPDLPAALVNDAAETETDGAYLVQFIGPVLEAWVQTLEKLGAQVGPYIPDYAFIVRLDASTRAAIEELSFVRWVGPFHPAYRISPQSADVTPNTFRVVLLPWADVPAVSRALGAFAYETPGAARVQQYAADGLSAVLDAAGAQQAARLPGVQWVEPVTLNETYNDVAGGIMNAGEAWNVDLDGTDVIIGVADTGLDISHPDFAGRILQAISYPIVAGMINECIIDTDANDDGLADDDGVADVNSGHGTHVTGSLAGSGAQSAGAFKGTAPKASIIFQAIEQYTTFKNCTSSSPYFLTGIPLDAGELLEDAHALGVRVHNNSWGSTPLSGGVFGSYYEDASSYDQRIFQYQDLLVTVAAGNYGRDVDPRNGYTDEKSLSLLAASKNTLAVGASDSYRTSGGLSLWTWYNLLSSSFYLPPTGTDYPSDNIQEMAAFSSRGPTADGRIKPDVVAPGTNIISTLAQGTLFDTTPGWGVYNQYYMYNGGTSMAAPLAAGAAALVREHYIDRLSVANPSAALVKATLINTAVDITGYGNPLYEAGLPIPNMHEGWGRIDAAAAVQIGSSEYIDNKIGLGTTESQQWSFSVPYAMPLKVTLVWSDKEAASNTGTAKTLVNNLDLEVTSPNGDLYLGNAFSGGWSIQVGTPDLLNNVENVYIQQPATGTWTVRVKGTNVPQGIDGKQPFALVVNQQAPEVQPISPDRALNDAVLNDVLVKGNYLLNATSVRLVGDALTIPGTIDSNGETQLTVDFDLKGKTPGVYHLEVITPFGMRRLAQPFYVLDASLPDLKLTLEPVKKIYYNTEPVTLTLRLENASLVDAGSVVFTESLPAGFTFSSIAPACAELTSLADGFECVVGDLPAGEVLTYTVTAQPTSYLSGDFTTQAITSSGAADRWVEDNTDLAVFWLNIYLDYLPVITR